MFFAESFSAFEGGVIGFVILSCFSGFGMIFKYLILPIRDSVVKNIDNQIIFLQQSHIERQSMQKEVIESNKTTLSLLEKLVGAIGAINAKLDKVSGNGDSKKS